MIKICTTLLLIFGSYCLVFSQEEKTLKEGLVQSTTLKINDVEVTATISEFFTNSDPNFSSKKIQTDLPSLSPKIYKVEHSRSGYINVYHHPAMQPVDLLQLFRILGLNYAYVDRTTHKEIYIDSEGRLLHK